jgi:dihydropteroate synthase
MGILNITPDSFSDGGKFNSFDNALRQAEKMVEDGADIIDVGGESTRPGARSVGPKEEVKRVIPVVREIKKRFKVLVSIDTYKAAVARQAVLEGGADIINDISALSFDPAMAGIVADLQTPLILMHIKGTPRNMQKNPRYRDVLQEICDYFQERIEYCCQSGTKEKKIILDPGIGFGKRLLHNIQIIKNLQTFKQFGLPVMIGLSRKSFLGLITGEENPADRESETLTANIVSILKGADILRVHDVKSTCRSIRILKELWDW